MKRFLILFLVFAYGLYFDVAAQGTVKITVANKSDISRKDAVVEVPWADILKVSPNIDTANLLVIQALNKQAVAHQLEYKGSKNVQHLLLQLSVPAGKTVTLLIKNAKPSPEIVKTFARFVPERKDDFAWENDKIAFRMYGKALENTKENAHGIDVWAKRTTKMVINERYKLDKYHIDNGDGLDYYHVGKTLGAGNIAPYIADSVWYLGNYTSYKVLDNGPLRSTFQLIYPTANADGLKISAVKTITLDAGSQLNKISQIYSFDKQTEIPVAIGFILRNEPDKISLTDPNGIVAYWEPAHGEDGIIGVGAILPNKPKKYVWQKKQLLAVSAVNNGQPFIYYAGAAWNKAGEITSSEQWFEYLKTYKKYLAAPLTVKVSKK
ncbi:DUF4861 family protein [Nubsella zeaxanthinifaciens]|uniref:DUF4861 family protein n=1 Tax=Nubsella zeaxanthinifaciens TaxID=392412 RepID=UPI003D086C00